ncbi:MAG: glycine cleavage system protein R [Acidimicrobiales bacterium]
MTTLVLTAIGNDQSGLVNALARVIADNGGSWDESRMGQLAGKFAGIVQVSVPDTRADELITALQPLSEQGLLDITVTRAEDAEPEAGERQLALNLVGQDRPGIIEEISQTLADLNVTIKELETSTANAPMAGGMLFEASALLGVPAGVADDQLKSVLEQLANELMVDLDLTVA